jgi:FkbM family methyltransferase
MLITEAYRAEQAALHAKGNYGTASLQYGDTVLRLIQSSGARSLLDYGCGSKRSLLQALALPEGVVYEGYDPAIPEFSAKPIPAELVCCIDVLEHIEPPLLDGVLDHLAGLCDPYGFFTIHTGPAVKVLSDGRNAHLIQQGPDWWLPKLRMRFELIRQAAIPSGFVVLVRSLQSEIQLPVPELASLPSQKQGRVGADGAAPDVGADERKVATKGGIPQFAVVKHPDGKMVFNTPNRMTAWRVQSLATKEPHTLKWLESMPLGSTLLDIGANVGMYTVYAAVIRQAKVFAFEPESQNFALLNANIESNKLVDQVMAFPLALSDEASLSKLYMSEFSIGSSCHSFGEEVGFDLKPRKAAFTQGSYSVPVDHLVESGAMPVPDYVKIDVDGFEHKVIAGARKTLRNEKVREVLVELNTHLPEHQEAVKELQALGFEYDSAQVDQALRKEGSFKGVGEFIFRRAHSQAIDFGRSYQLAPVQSSRGRSVMHHVLSRVMSATTTEDPFPYLVVDDVFPTDYYAEMISHFPSADSLRPIGETGRVTKGGYDERLVVLFTDEEFARMTTPQQMFWREFASWMYADEFLYGFLHKFHAHLEHRISKIVKAERSLRMKSDALLVNDQTNYAIGPHTDAPHRLVTFLFYLPRDASMRELGTSIYRPRDRAFECWGGPHHDVAAFERVTTVEFLPNRLLAFPKTAKSFHGVEPIQRKGVNRPLLINNIRLLNMTKH